MSKFLEKLKKSVKAKFLKKIVKKNIQSKETEDRK